MTHDIQPVSVIIPAYGSCPYLPKIVHGLSEQSRRPDEIIIVHSGIDAPSDLQNRYPGLVKVIHFEQRKNAAMARNIGLSHARFDLVSFIDADVVPDTNWLQALITAHNSHHNSFIVGSVGYETDGGYWGMCVWMIEFSGIHPYLPQRAVQGGGSGNFIAYTKILRELGAFSERYNAGEDIHLMAKLRQYGLKNHFYPKAVVKHVNLPGFGHYAQHLDWLGYWSGTYRMSLPWNSKKALYVVLCPFLWIIRLLLIYYRVLRWGTGLRGKSLALFPGILLGTLLWNLGVLKSSFRHSKQSLGTQD